MKRILGIFVLLIVVYLATWVMSDLMTGRQSFLSAFNQENLLRRTALFGIIGIGVAFVIMTGGIDLSIGSVICLVGVGFPWMVTELNVPLGVALPLVVILSLLIGLSHGVLVTFLRLQPFIVTLCGLLLYRGLTRGLTNDQTAGFQGEFKTLRWFANGEIPITSGFGLPVPLIILILIAVAASIFLNRTIYGRYLLALGNNEDAARFSGIDTKRMTILAYVICSFLAGLGGLLFVLDTNSAQPVDFGNFYELFAIAAAVLGGCSLRGGSGTIIGVIIGTALIQLLRNMITLVDYIPQNIEFAVIGAVILAGAVGDEVAKQISASRKQT
ncbi:MAG: ABC transporter permease [Verrucomicrobiales bacterium]|jgi:ribose transport system permease protein|nr:ABC transporter permease [bacterium]MDF2375293.1 ABC transporter permease [Verrucomicrobiales bacterium]